MMNKNENANENENVNENQMYHSISIFKVGMSVGMVENE